MRNQSEPSILVASINLVDCWSRSNTTKWHTVTRDNTFCFVYHLLLGTRPAAWHTTTWHTTGWNANCCLVYLHDNWIDNQLEMLGLKLILFRKLVLVKPI